jgi:hypothetical protein
MEKMHIDIQKITNINIDNEIKTIINLHNQIDDYCDIETQNISSPNAIIFERIITASDILMLNAIRYNKNRSYTVELESANVTNNVILDILSFIANELSLLNHPKDLLDNVFFYLKRYKIEPYFILRDKKDDLLLYNKNI